MKTSNPMNMKGSIWKRNKLGTGKRAIRVKISSETEKTCVIEYLDSPGEFIPVGHHALMRKSTLAENWTKQ